MTDFIPETQQIVACRRQYEIALAKYHESMTADARDALGKAAAAWTRAVKAERDVETGTQDCVCDDEHYCENHYYQRQEELSTSWLR